MLYSDGSDGFSPCLKEQVDRKGHPQGKVTVEVYSVDQLVEDKVVPLPTVLKIDIEGAEILFLRGAKKLLSGQLGDQPRLIFLELHPEFLPYFDSNAEEVCNLLSNYGYISSQREMRDKQVHYTYQLQKTAIAS